MGMLLIQWFGALVGGAVGGHNLMPALPFMALMAGDVLTRTLAWVKQVNKTTPVNATGVLIIAICLLGFLPPLVKYTIFPGGDSNP